MTTTTPQRDARQRLNAAGWGLLLAWTGLALLLPGELRVLWHVWRTGVGAVLLGASGAGVALGLHPTGFTVVLGVLVVVWGIAGLAGVPISVVGLALILIGLAYVVSGARRWATADR